MRPPQKTGENPPRGTEHALGQSHFNEAPAENGGKHDKGVKVDLETVTSMRPPQKTGENSACWKPLHKQPLGRECERL